MTRSRQCFCRSDIVKFMTLPPYGFWRGISGREAQFRKTS
jgi:hypothetical protein